MFTVISRLIVRICILFADTWLLGSEKYPVDECFSRGRIQNPVKYLRISILRKQLAAQRSILEV